MRIREALLAILFSVAVSAIFGGCFSPSRELRAVVRTQEIVLTDYVTVANLAIEKDPALAGTARGADYWIAVGEKLVRNQGDISDLLGVDHAKEPGE